MQTWANTSSAGSSATPAFQPLTISGAGSSVTGINGFVMFCPTARDLSLIGGGAGTVGQEAMRTATTCYMRGLSEKCRVQTSSGQPWLWRRICFATKDTTFRLYSSADTPSTANLTNVETSNGQTRTAINQIANSAPNSINNWQDIIFKGTKGVDWVDAITASVDTRRVDLKYDRTYKIHSGNTSGYFSEKKMWHPMNKNITYADDESGQVETTSNYSVLDKRGMGDYLVVDIFSCLLGGTSSDLLSIQYDASIYWHEK